MRFRTVILLSIWSVVAGALIVGYVMVNVAMREHISTRAAADLRTHRSTMTALFSLQLEELGKTTELFAETPRLKAVAELGDSNTVRQLMSELQPGIGADILGVADRDGRQMSGSRSGELFRFHPSLFFPRDDSLRARVIAGVTALDTAVYRIASAPILVGTDVVGRLILGFRISDAYLGSLKEMIGSDLALTVDRRPAVTTLAGGEREGIARWLREGATDIDAGPEAAQNLPSIPAGNESFMTTAIAPAGYGPAATRDQVRLVILKPIRRETELALEPVLRSFILLSAAVLVVTIGVGFLVSRGVTRPIAGLVRGTAEISRGNYDYAMEIPKGVELKFLATKFGEMSASLKEKVRQLGERNMELELALRKLRETQEELIRSERLAATGKLTAQLSHEINNPVHNILSSLQTALKKTPADAASRELLEVAYDEVERLARLTKQLLIVYRDSVTSPEPRKPVDINAIVRDVVASSGEMLRQNRVAVDLFLAERIPLIGGSDDKLKQLFLNLIVNARDAMPEGGRLSISSSAGDGRIRVAVADTGMGIPPENINRVFDAFFTTKGKVSGTGLGLSVSYGIVQQHKGTITVQSRPGQGATFTVTFPADIEFTRKEQA
ncbi:MAG TPA: ATP-binding protein [Bacteroidota bacterium]|nr:ATP-binding protein [Bacteroidota bacterium]